MSSFQVKSDDINVNRKGKINFLAAKSREFGMKVIKNSGFKLKYNSPRKGMQVKVPVMVISLGLKILPLEITVQHYSASLVMPHS